MTKRTFINPTATDPNSRTIIVHNNGYFHTERTECCVEWEFKRNLDNFPAIRISIPHQTFQVEDIDELLSFLFVAKDRLNGV